MSKFIRPIRATEISFDDDKELREFKEYATSKIQTNNEIVNRVRRDFKSHKKSLRRKYDSVVYDEDVNTNRSENKGNVLPIVKPIQQTPVLTGTFAQEFLKEIMKKPSAASIERNKEAQELLRRMKR